MQKVSKASFRKAAEENGLAFVGYTKRPLAEVVELVENQPKYNGGRDEVRVSPSGTLYRKFTRDGKEVESALELTKNHTIYVCNGYFLAHASYPKTPGYDAWEQTLIYA